MRSRRTRRGRIRAAYVRLDLQQYSVARARLCSRSRPIDHRRRLMQRPAARDTATHGLRLCNRRTVYTRGDMPNAFCLPYVGKPSWIPARGAKRYVTELCDDFVRLWQYDSPGPFFELGL
jgi:hypothetical protein